MSLKKGDILYSNIIFTRKGEKVEYVTAVVTAKAALHPVEGFVLPIKRRYGAEDTGKVTKFGEQHWRTDKELTEPVVLADPNTVRSARRVQMPARAPKTVESQPEVKLQVPEMPVAPATTMKRIARKSKLTPEQEAAARLEIEAFFQSR